MPWILPAQTVGPSGGEFKNYGLPPQYFGRSWPDSMVFDVAVDSSGVGVSRPVTVSLMAWDSAATSIDSMFGHFHFGRIENGDNRPKPTGFLDRSALTTDSTGKARFVYHPSEVSGPVLLRILTANADTSMDTLWIGVPNLVSLTAGARYDLKNDDASNAHHYSRFWVTPSMKVLIEDFADSIVANFAERPVFTDAGLPFCGKHDLDDQWAGADPGCELKHSDGTETPNPFGCHERHRMGLDVDLRTNDSSRERLLLTQRLWRDLTGINVFQEGDHYHLRYRN